MEVEWIVFAAALGLGASGWLMFLWRRRKAADSREALPKERSEPRGTSLFEGLRRTRERLWGAWSQGGTGDAYATLEEALVTADVGTDVASNLVAGLRRAAGNTSDVGQLRDLLARELVRVFPPTQPGFHEWLSTPARPLVVLFVGVNGVGKTTSIAKLAFWLRRKGLRVLFVAADTFRAAAAEQLQTWADRLGVGCIRHQAGSDPAAVVYDGIQAARAREIDVVLIDTAGRLHSKQPLVEELRKMVRTAERLAGKDAVRVLLVIDATNGQNALTQARVLSEAMPVAGVCLTKLDGTAKGGVAVSIAAKLKLPIYFVGLGEDLGAWQEFDPGMFVAALLGERTDHDPAFKFGRYGEHPAAPAA
ncbi:MAG: signal recognition particle receptor FtsY [Candidatus Binatia bacterium]|nr:MAG: signal recognition particle receptor FtsY [Candidatus Binatia bacterium]